MTNHKDEAENWMDFADRYYIEASGLLADEGIREALGLNEKEEK